MWSLPDRILLNKYYKVIGNQVNTNCKILNIGGNIYNIFYYGKQSKQLVAIKKQAMAIFPEVKDKLANVL